MSAILGLLTPQVCVTHLKGMHLAQELFLQPHERQRLPGEGPVPPVLSLQEAHTGLYFSVLGLP